MQFKHNFYSLDSPTPFTAEFDFVITAGLIINYVNRLNMFSKSSDDLGICTMLEGDIDTGNAFPIRQPPVVHLWLLEKRKMI